jgi:NADPH-dependent 2,4-dienoyl-CoA reductase/sulfur reductase-like enzyme
VRPCIACNACVDLVGKGLEVRCAVNPEAGREATWRIESADETRRVMVVGAGPAGLEAARVARLRGHDVSLWERDAEIGGKLDAASRAPSKSEVLRFRDYERRTLAELGVEVHTGVDVTAALIEREAPDVVVIATGAGPLVPPIPGIDGPDVIDAQAILRGEAHVAPGEHVTVVGGSATGCETAELLLQLGARVTIVEMLESVGRGIEAITRRHLVRALRAGGVEILTGKAVVGVEPGRVHVQAVGGGPTEEIRTSLVALAVGWRPRGAELASVLGDRTTWVVGDAERPADFVAAVDAGARAGCAV